jgi:hypothetical protein
MIEGVFAPRVTYVGVLFVEEKEEKEEERQCVMSDEYFSVLWMDCMYLWKRCTVLFEQSGSFYQRQTRSEVFRSRL